MWLAALCFVWAGMVLGISFLETPVKFTAPSLTLPVGLDVGRHVFGMFNKVEIGWVVLACILILMTRPKRAAWLPIALPMLIVGLQTCWLFPVMDARVSLILSGQTPPSAPYHLIYIALEVVKLVCLVVAGITYLRALKPVVPPLS